MKSEAKGRSEGKTKMRVLVFNCGSSSLKYRLLEMPGEKELAGGEAQRIGPPTAEPARVVHRAGGAESIVQADMPNHGAAFEQIMKILGGAGIRPDAIGHRVVHGGMLFKDPTVINRDVLAGFKQVEDLAPIHNPPAFRLIEAVTAIDPGLPQVAVFDTAYHSTIPGHARVYSIPLRLRRAAGIRKYGFHGTSHQFVAQEAARFLGMKPDQLNAVSCHLGSGGASLCAIVDGKSIDNTMGHSPLQGLVMSTRCGDLDPAVALQLVARSNGDTQKVESMLNRKSGVLGVSGTTADIRDVLAGVEKSGGQDDQLAMAAEIYLWRVRKYLGSYLALVGRPHAIIFTDSVGEEAPGVRWAVCAGMDVFGVRMDPHRNAKPGTLPADVATDNSPVRILVVRTNEELAIARQTYERLAGGRTGGRKVKAA